MEPHPTEPTGASAGPWLAGVYELNACGEAWAGFSVLTSATVRFATKQEAYSALGVAVDGDSYTSTDTAAVERARKLIRPALINSRHAPGQLVLFVLHAPHLDGTGLMTYTASDSDRSISAMTQALTPAPDADHARARLLEAVAAANAHPERDVVENFVETHFGIAPDSTGPEAERAAQTLATLTDEFRGDWFAYVGNTRIGVFHSACWTRQPNAGRSAWWSRLRRSAH
jgi:hypothetical protein